MAFVNHELSLHEKLFKHLCHVQILHIDEMIANVCCAKLCVFHVELDLKILTYIHSDRMCNRYIYTYDIKMR